MAGEGGVGKTTLLRRYQSGTFVPASTTIGINFVTIQIQFQDHPIVACVWDYAGENRFKTLFPGYTSGSKAGLAVFDLSRVESLQHLSDWVNIIREKNGQIPIILVGCKADTASESQVAFIGEQAKDFANRYGLKGFFMVSSKTGAGVVELFDFLSNQLIQTLAFGQ